LQVVAARRRSPRSIAAEAIETQRTSGTDPAVLRRVRIPGWLPAAALPKASSAA